jgi:hypothetical protein
MEDIMKDSAWSCLFYFFLFLAIAPLILSSPIFAMAVQNDEMSPVDEEIQIKRAVEDLYIKGLLSRDFSLITTVCIPQALLMSADREGNLHTTTLESWSKRFDPQNSPFQKLDFCIVKIDRRGSAAQVKISFFVDSKQHVIDFLHMLKLDGKWRIVNIIDF